MPQFPISKVPVPGKLNPVELPKPYDPAEVILQAQALQQKRDELKQKATESLSDTVKAAADLFYRGQEIKLKEREADAFIQLRNAQTRSAEASTEFQNLVNTGELEVTTVTDPVTGRTSHTIAPTKSGPKVTPFPQGQTKPSFQQQKNDPERLLTEKEQSAYGLPSGKKLKDSFGIIPVSPAERDKIIATQGVATQAAQLREMVDALELGDDVKTSLVRGGVLKAQSFHPSTAAGKYDAASKNISNLARAYGEKGVLTDLDIKRVSDNLPRFIDTKTGAYDKLDNIDVTFATAVARQKEGLVGDILKSGRGAVSREGFLGAIGSRSKEDKVRLLTKAIKLGLVQR